MYVPAFNEENDISVMHALIRQKPLGAWSAIVDGAIEVNHIPFVLHENRGEFGTLAGHVARSNPIWQGLSESTESVIVFQGEQAYISPSWYPSKHKHGKAVPTWNYAVVHARGVPVVIDNPDWILQHVNELTDTHERDQALPWKVSDAPDDFIQRMTAAIVGIEIPLSQLTGKWKLGQNRPEPDKMGIIAGLMANDNTDSQGLAKKLQQHTESSS